MGTSAWRPLAVARGGRFTSKTDGGSHREDPPPNEAMYCRAKATEAKRCAVGQVLAMYCRFAAYGWLGPWQYNPSEGLLLKFSGDLVYLVLIRGSNLDLPLKDGAANLTTGGLQRHRVLWIQEM